jgi:hypothetical protein
MPNATCQTIRKAHRKKKTMCNQLATATLMAAATLISQVNAKESCVRVVNQAMVSKLCPDPNARCLVRDNPDFYKESDPALYNRITKCKE